MNPHEFFGRVNKFIQKMLDGESFDDDAMRAAFDECLLLKEDPAFVKEAAAQAARIVDDVQKNRNRPDASDQLWRDVNKLYEDLGGPDEFYPRPDKGE